MGNPIKEILFPHEVYHNYYVYIYDYNMVYSVIVTN